MEKEVVGVENITNSTAIDGKERIVSFCTTNKFILTELKILSVIRQKSGSQNGWGLPNFLKNKYFLPSDTHTLIFSKGQFETK